LEVSGFGASFSRYAQIGKIKLEYGIMALGNKKARLTVLVSCLLNSSILRPFKGSFLWTFLGTFKKN
jgi:hypothetical protein